MKPILYTILISSLLTNIFMGVVSYQAYQTQESLKVPIETLSKVSKELSTELKDFTFDELKDSYNTGYINDKKEEAKEEIDSLITKIFR